MLLFNTFSISMAFTLINFVNCGILQTPPRFPPPNTKHCCWKYSNWKSKLCKTRKLLSSSCSSRNRPHPEEAQRSSPLLVSVSWVTYIAFSHYFFRGICLGRGDCCTKCFSGCWLITALPLFLFHMIGPTAAELAAQNELSEKLALLRSQEANLSEQLTTVSNKLAQYNTDLEKVNLSVIFLLSLSICLFTERVHFVSR